MSFLVLPITVEAFVRAGVSAAEQVSLAPQTKASQAVLGFMPVRSGGVSPKMARSLALTQPVRSRLGAERLSSAQDSKVRSGLMATSDLPFCYWFGKVNG